MPTIVEKGPLWRDMERYLRSSARRKDLLVALVSHGPVNAGNVDGFVDTLIAEEWKWSRAIYIDPAGLPAPAPVLEKGRDTALYHLKTQWFSAANIFNILAEINPVIVPPTYEFRPLSADEAAAAAELLRMAFIDALEASLGVASGWKDVAVPSMTQLDAEMSLRDWPLEIYWVCGKGDGFEVLIEAHRLQRSSINLCFHTIKCSLKLAWSGIKQLAQLKSPLVNPLRPLFGGVVTMNIVTPPVHFDVPDLMFLPDGVDDVKTKKLGVLCARTWNPGVAASMVLPPDLGGAE
jgi:hypothetical protein